LAPPPASTTTTPWTSTCCHPSVIEHVSRLTRYLRGAEEPLVEAAGFNQLPPEGGKRCIKPNPSQSDYEWVFKPNPRFHGWQSSTPTCIRCPPQSRLTHNHSCTTNGSAGSKSALGPGPGPSPMQRPSWPLPLEWARCAPQQHSAPGAILKAKLLPSRPLRVHLKPAPKQINQMSLPQHVPESQPAPLSCPQPAPPRD
jgi:hypothetical protein